MLIDDSTHTRERKDPTMGGKPSRQQQNLAELRRLEADRQAGKITEAEYDYWKARIIADSKPRSAGTAFLKWAAIIAVIWLIVFILGRIIDAANLP